MQRQPDHDAASGGLRFAPELMARIDALAAFTEVEGQLTRRYLSPAHTAAMRQVEAWMADAGMAVRTDPLLSVLEVRDAAGITVREALAQAGGNADAYRDCVRPKGAIAAFLELHIEQGPVLEAQGKALAAVTAINGSVRSVVTVTGFAGHAGTVPMERRRDALAAASEMILAVERIAASAPDLVATVGRIAALPGAQNVIPGRVTFTIDMRSPSDAVRDRAHAALVPALHEIALRRGAEVEIDTYQRNAATALDPLIIDAVSEAIAACGQEPLRLPSGAGHDAMIMAKHCPSGMIFLRCKDGISHNPAESITVEDADLGVRALLEAVRLLDGRLG